MKEQLIANRLAIAVKRQGNTRIVHAFLRPFRNLATIGEVREHNGVIHNFKVHPGYRRFGVGAKLFRVAINQFESPVRLRLYARAEVGGVTQVQLEKFYSSFGFVPTGRLSPSGGIEMVLDR